VIETKSQIRTRYRRLRAGITAEARDAASHQACSRILQLADDLDVHTVHVFYPIDRHNELDTRPLIRRLADSGRTVLMPVVSSTTEGLLIQRPYLSEEALTPNAFGGLEPPSGLVVRPSELDLAIVPAIAADRRGFRVGYGKGFYDRFLSEVRCPAVCAVYSICLIDYIPEEEHDVPVQYVATEREILPTAAAAT
jgi:5-formyltetrahydrofolate cyclo-ligase